MAVPPIKKLEMPSNLAHVKPGELPASLLVPIKPYGKLHPLAANAYNAVRAAAFAAGITQFKAISAGDTYRSIALQRQGFLARYQLAPIEGVKPRVYEGKNYYLKPGNAPMAVPGSSRHNLGLAVDFANMSGATFAFMCEHGPTFGWSLEVMPAEPWHWFYWPGDRVPPAVTQYLQSVAPVSPTA
jgi:LAS superfamily LD-carboxypeptidase LdcB